MVFPMFLPCPGVWVQELCLACPISLWLGSMTLESAWIGLGANLGNPPRTFRAALRQLAREPGVRLEAVSPFYRTAPVGPPGQPPYLNAAVRLRVRLSPGALLTILLRTERAFGRDRAREVRWGPRRLDLDILLFGNRDLSLPGLTIPHPELLRRAFALKPLADLNPRRVHPRLGKTVDRLLREADSLGAIHRLG